MSDRITGYLEVGINDSNEVVINHPDLTPGPDGIGHIVFSPNQARGLAALLNRKAAEADGNDSEKEYFIAFYTKDCPAGTMDCVRVRLDMVRQHDMNKPMDIGLVDDPLYRELRYYVKENAS